MGVPVNEQETIIQFSRDESFATIYTSDRTYINKLNKLVAKSNQWEETLVERDSKTKEVVCKKYRCPKKLISFRSKTTTINLTEEQRNLISSRMKRKTEQKKEEHNV